MIAKTNNEYLAPDCEEIRVLTGGLLCNSFRTEGLTDEDEIYTW